MKCQKAERLTSYHCERPGLGLICYEGRGPACAAEQPQERITDR